MSLFFLQRIKCTPSKTGQFQKTLPTFRRVPSVCSLPHAIKRHKQVKLAKDFLGVGITRRLQKKKNLLYNNLQLYLLKLLRQTKLLNNQTVYSHVPKERPYFHLAPQDILIPSIFLPSMSRLKTSLW